MDDADLGTEDSGNTLMTSLIAHGGFTADNDERLLLSKLQRLVTSIKWRKADAAELFEVLLKRFESTTNEPSDLILWMLKMLQCIEINYITPTWKYQKGRTLIELVRDKTLSDEELKRCLDNNTEKDLEEILEEIRQEKSIDDGILEKVKDIVLSVHDALKYDKDLEEGSTEKSMKKDLFLLCKAAKKIKFQPRLTQMVSWCIMALSKTGRLIQVGTGEGKSCIVAMFAAYQAMQGKKVDVMSSSPVLAERDMKDWLDFYKELKISISCNSNRLEKDLKGCYERQVVYGTVEEFAGDWLRHHFKRQDILGQRKPECAIVDEVDSLMLDKGLHVVYLSTDMPSLQHLNPLLAFIWSTVNQCSKISSGTTLGPKFPFYQAMLEKIKKSKEVDDFTILQMAEDSEILARGTVGILRKDMSLLTEKLAHLKVNQLVKFFDTIEMKFPSCQFNLHSMGENGTIEELNKAAHAETAETQRDALVLIDGGFCQYMCSSQERLEKAVETEVRNAVRFTPCDLNQDKCVCYIPGFLSDLVQHKLKVWIENAFFAQTMSSDHEYIIEPHGVVPVDYSCTGVVENQMKWTDGLQQFLEMKHEQKLSDMSVITNYMSNVGLLQKYGDQIFGVSGTLGQKAETDTLHEIYNGLRTCKIPSFKRRKLFEVEGVIVDKEKEWIEKLCDVVTTETSPTSFRSQRAVLVICETISRAKALHCALGDKIPNKKLYISNNMDNKAIFSHRLTAGEVIIATNLAGRGTDLQVSEPVNAAGGLFVVQSFLPRNARVEAQAFGRTARQGAPGSAQLIVCSSHQPEHLKLLLLIQELTSLMENFCVSLFVGRLKLYQARQGIGQSPVMSLLLRILSENSDSGLKMIKMQRNDSVAKRLASFLEYNIPKIKMKEELFVQYLETLDEVYKSSANTPDKSYLSGLNEFWGMWLLMNVTEENSIAIIDLQNKLTKDLEFAGKKLKQSESPLSNLHFYTETGNELQKKGQLAESITMYTKAIEEDPCWAAMAFYNRAFASLTQQNGCQDPSCLSQALQDLQNALKSAELYLEQIEVTHRYSGNKVNLDSLSRFDKHVRTRKDVWVSFKANIFENMWKVDQVKDLGGTVKVKGIDVYTLAPVNLLLVVVLAKLSFGTSLSRDPLMIQQLISHPSYDIISELGCLESLGLTQVYTLQ